MDFHKEQKIKITGPKHPIQTNLLIDGSKSISNRVLMIRALSQQNFAIENLSGSDDTNILLKNLDSVKSQEYDCHHAGTTFRFLTAYFAIMDDTQILTGSNRMKDRPISDLVEALNDLGADICYLEKEGYPPLSIKPFKKQTKNKIKIKADISSQFVSALCLIAPILQQGLTIELEGTMVSSSYINMTLEIMNHFGVSSLYSDKSISIESQKYTAKTYTVESDWSSASYHFSIASLCPNSKIRLKNFFENSLQGDSAIIKMAKSFGVNSKIVDNELIIQSTSLYVNRFAYDFIQNPDLVQTIAVMAAAKNINVLYNGLSTLKIKETDRIKALKQELKKINVVIKESPGMEFELEQIGMISIINPEFDTYQDHRMAMALAPLALLSPIVVRDPEVVSKSYPQFWDDLTRMGFEIEPLN